MTASFFGYLSSLNLFVKCCLFRQKQGDTSLLGIELLLFSFAPLLLTGSTVPAFAVPSPQIAQIAPFSITRPNLQLGSQGQPVSELQAALKLLGFYTGAVDGIYNEATAKAVSQFQLAAGLNANGIVDAITWQKLFPGEAIASSPSPSSTTAVTNSANNFPVPTQIVNNSTTTTTQTANNSTTTTTQTANNSTTTTIPEPKPATPPKQTTSTNSQKKTVTQSSSNRSQQSTRTQQSTSSQPTKRTQQSTRSTPSQSTKRTQPTPRFEQISGVQYTSKGYPILRPGMNNAEVRRLQLRLRKLGYLKSDADGDFGQETEAAVQALQKRYDIEPDGVVGGETWEVLLQRR
ncbi:MAG: peptidoglycan-binding protein [Hapalosiphonaceae cyanobacterium JJU2]|nr:MAG: peptidoglycan-binding protein [Hapalosiphonaceae cyanobacterium JJU2]